MSPENKTILLKRFKSFMWRAGAVLGVSFVAFILDNIGLLSVPEWVVIGIGLIGGEITKYLNTYLLSTTG